MSFVPTPAHFTEADLDHHLNEIFEQCHAIAMGFAPREEWPHEDEIRRPAAAR